MRGCPGQAPDSTCRIAGGPAYQGKGSERSAGTMMASLAHAHARFGLGARPGDLDGRMDGRDWVLGQLAGTPAVPEALRGLPDSRENMAAVLEARRDGTQKVGAMVREQFLPQ